MRREAIFPSLLSVCVFTPLPLCAQAPESSVSPTLQASETPAPPLEEEPIQPSPHSTDRCHVGVEFILWWLREGRVPPLLTTSSAGSAGMLGRPDTHVLYGDRRL